jgi:hypothetical protein
MQLSTRKVSINAGGLAIFALFYTVQINISEAAEILYKPQVLYNSGRQAYHLIPLVTSFKG